MTKSSNSVWQYPINVKNITDKPYLNQSKDVYKPTDRSKPTPLPNIVDNTVFHYRREPIKRPVIEEADSRWPYKYYFDNITKTEPIQQRFHPPVKKPSSQNILPKPAESILFNQIIKPPKQSFNVIPQPVETISFDPVLEQPAFVPQEPSYNQNFGYPTASYVTLRPVFFTTTALSAIPPAKSVEEGPITHYYPGNKLWYIALYFGFAFIVLYGYMIIEGIVRRRISYPLYRKLNNEELVELSSRILSSVQKVAEMYDVGC